MNRRLLVLKDIARPLLNGLDSNRQIRESQPGIQVLALSADSDGAYMERAAAMVDAMSQKEIAAELVIGITKVHPYHRNLMRKVTSAVARSRLRELG